jgi:hypothetical protein
MIVKHAGLAPGAYGNLIYIIIPHAAWVARGLLKCIRDHDPPHRIDGLMIAALSYILWFGVVPLFSLWQLCVF